MLPSVLITKRRHTLFGHVVRLEATTPAHQALEQVVATKAGHCPGTGEDLVGVPGGHGYNRSAREPQPVGDRCGRVWRNVDIAESRRNGPQPSTRHGDDNDVVSYVTMCNAFTGTVRMQ